MLENKKKFGCRVIKELKIHSFDIEGVSDNT